MHAKHSKSLWTTSIVKIQKPSITFFVTCVWLPSITFHHVHHTSKFQRQLEIGNFAESSTWYPTKLSNHSAIFLPSFTLCFQPQSASGARRAFGDFPWSSASALRGETPLHWAAIDGHASVVPALLEAGADVNAADNNGQGRSESGVKGRRLRSLVFSWDPFVSWLFLGI